MGKLLPLLVFLYRTKTEILIFCYLMGSSIHNSFRKQRFSKCSNSNSHVHVIHEFTWFIWVMWKTTERKEEVYTSLLMWLVELYEQTPLEYVFRTPFWKGAVDSFLVLNTPPLSAILPRATNDPSLNKVRYNLCCPRPTQALTQLDSPFPKIETHKSYLCQLSNTACEYK